MIDRLVNSITGRLSLREPQRRSLEILARLVEIAPAVKQADLAATLATIGSEFPSVTDFEREFPSLCFALATGVGKTRLMGAFISYLHLAKGINHFFVLAPNLTIYNKLIADFTPNTSKYVFKGIAEFSIDPPLVVTGDNYESGLGVRGSQLFQTGIHINIFNISKINSEVRGGKAPRIKRLSEYIGESYFDYLSNLPDLVLLMDESHRYRAAAGMNAINELKPILGLELTATPFIEAANRQIPFKNVIYDFPLSKAMEAGFVKEPAVVTQKNFKAEQFTPTQLEQIKLEDGIRIHENTKVELETYARQTDQAIVKPFMLVVARDTAHADYLQRLIESELFDGRYQGKAIQIHSNQTGDEKEEVVQRLLTVERNDEPTEIVIHVNMLKEGWDVTNLYTIVPLRPAKARTLVEQSIGRGLRLPYGKRTGVSAVDTLNIVAHDKFQEIIDEANSPDSPIRLKTLILDPVSDFQKTKTVVISPNLDVKLGQQLAATISNDGIDAEPRSIFTSETEKRVVEAVLTAIKHHEDLPTSTYLLKSDVQEMLVKEAEVLYRPIQMDLPGVETPPDIKKIVAVVTKSMIQETIDIPKIVVIPKGKSTVGFKSFTLDLSGVRIQPVDRDLLKQFLRTNHQETLTFNKVAASEARLEDYIVRGLIDFEDIAYDAHSDLLYNLAEQLVVHLRSYLSEEETRNVLLYHQKLLVDVIHVQMHGHLFEDATEYEVKVTKGFTGLKKTAITVPDTEKVTDYRKPDFDKKVIGQMVFGGFSKNLYQYAKFASDTERRLAAILERESLKWFRPVKGQFQIFYKKGGDQPEYVPDFVAECDKVIYLIETKARGEIEAPDVQNKKVTAEKWCQQATEHNANFGAKPWKYLFIAHDEVQENMTLSYFEGR
jgi:type III restriction enzyme